MLLKSLLLLKKLISHCCKLAILELGREVFLDAEVNLLTACPLHEVEFVLIGEEDEEVIVVVVMESEDEPFLVLPVVLGEVKPKAGLDLMFVVLHLIDQLVSSQEGECFCLSTECCLHDRSEPLKEDSIDEIEVVIAVISDLCDRILSYDHQILHILIIKAADGLININLLLVTTIFPLSHLLLPVYLIQVEIVIEDEEWSLAHKEA